MIRIVDGDTITVRLGETEETVRLLGIDAPESVEPGKAVECFAKESAAEAAREMQNKTVTIASDTTQPDRDIYGRLLRYVYLDDGTNVNRSMIEGGFAREYDFKGKKYEQRAIFEEAERVARETGKGLWGECNL